MSKTNSQILPIDDRRSRRTDVRLTATIDLGPGRSTTAIVQNVSAHGLMVEIDKRLVPGRPVAVEMKGLGRVPGRIAWTRDGHTGVAFVEPLTPEQINAIV